MVPATSRKPDMTPTLKDQMISLGMDGLSICEDTEVSPLPTDDEVVQTVTGSLSDMFSMLRETDLKPALQDIAWGFVNSFQKATERAERRWDEAAIKVKGLLEDQDGSEISTSQLEEAMEEAKRNEAQLAVCELMRETAADIFGIELGRAWQPIGSSRLNHSGMTSAVVDGRAYLRATADKKREARAPEGTTVVFAGGRPTITDVDANTFADNLFRLLDRVKTRVPDMVLCHGGDSQGVDRFAMNWAQKNKVPTARFDLERKLGKRAGFVRNDRMLSTNPAYVIALEGSGVVERLVETARQRNIQVIDRRGPLCTRPQRPARAA